METVRLERNTESRKASKSGNKNERKKERKGNYNERKSLT